MHKVVRIGNYADAVGNPFTLFRRCAPDVTLEGRSDGTYTYYLLYVRTQDQSHTALTIFQDSELVLQGNIPTFVRGARHFRGPVITDLRAMAFFEHCGVAGILDAPVHQEAVN